MQNLPHQRHGDSRATLWERGLAEAELAQERTQGALSEQHLHGSEIRGGTVDDKILQDLYTKTLDVIVV